jgi:microcompartment protein CcmK/EutM
MLCRQITPEGEDMEYTCLALDSVDSGEGDIVVIAQEGWSRRRPRPEKRAPRSIPRSSV